MLIWGLRIWFLLVLITQSGVVGWAMLQESLFHIPQPVVSDPWFIATLTDTYFAFIVFYLWVCYRENSLISRILWFLLIMGMGNIAIAAYMLLVLFKVSPKASIRDILCKGPRHA